MPIPSTTLEPSLHILAAADLEYCTKLSIGSKSCKRKGEGARAHAPFPSSVADGAQEDRP